jgi:hypothetical protein
LNQTAMPDGPMTIFRDKQHAEEFRANGCVSLPLLDGRQVEALRMLAEEHNVSDTNTYTNDRRPPEAEEHRVRHLRLGISELVRPALDRQLIDYRIVTAAFLIKRPDPQSYIPPHQDCSYTDEEEGVFDTMVCWIPLVRTTEANGTIGAILGSHRVLDAPSPPFPNPRVPRYHDEHVFELFPLLTMFDLDAGDALIFNNRTLHGSLPNCSSIDRPAVRIGLIHKDAPICHYFMKPGSGAARMLKYQVDDLFYDRFSNERLVRIFDNGGPMPGYRPVSELPYSVSQCDAGLLGNRSREILGD